VDWGVLTVIEEEGATALALFGGERLLPFAALYRRSRRPDELMLLGAEANLLAFYYDPRQERPSVVVWLAREAKYEWERWRDAKFAGNWDDPIGYAEFTVPIAEHFDQFLERLSVDPGN
jgi:hypothetical protein